MSEPRAEEGGSPDDAIHAAITKALLEGRLTPGAKLPEHRLAKLFGVSRERVRQIEVRAFEKVQAAVKAGVARAQLPPARAAAALPAL